MNRLSNAPILCGIPRLTFFQNQKDQVLTGMSLGADFRLRVLHLLTPCLERPHQRIPSAAGAAGFVQIHLLITLSEGGFQAAITGFRWMSFCWALMLQGLPGPKLEHIHGFSSIRAEIYENNATCKTT